MKEIVPPARGASCPAAAQIEFLVAGECVSPGVCAHVATCTGCSAYFRALHDDQQVFNLANTPELLLRKLERRTPPPSRWRWWLASAGVAVTLSVTLITSLPAPEPEPQPLALKAGTGFSVYASPSISKSPRPVPSGAHVSPGEVLRFAYTAKHTGYLMIVDLDGADQLTVFHPYRGREAVAVRANEPYSPGESIELDSASGPERIVAVFRLTPFTSRDVTDWLAASRGAPGIPSLGCADCSVEWVVLEKP